MRDDCWYNKVCTLEDKCDSCIRFIEMKYLMDSSNIPKNRQNPESLVPCKEDYHSFVLLQEIKSNIVNFVDMGRSLYIWGNTPGNGKTSWSIKLLLKYFDEIWAGNGLRRRGIFINVPHLLMQIKNFDKKDEKFEKLKEDLINVDLVVWDDIGSTNISNYDYSQLLTLIDQRVLNYKSNIFTGNLGNAQLERALGDKLSSRVWNNSQTIEIRGGDNRGNNSSNQ